MSDLPTGTIVMFMGPPDCVPPGWVLCDGRVVNIRNSPLRGRRTPDLRGRFPRGAADALDDSSLGESGGTTSICHAHEMSHTHLGLTFEPEGPASSNAASSSDRLFFTAPGDEGSHSGHGHSFTTSGPVPSTRTTEGEVPMDPPHVLVNFIMKVV